MNTNKKVIATTLTATSLFTSIQMQLYANDTLNIENHADFAIWIEEQKNDITNTKDITLEQITKEEDISEITQRYNYLIGYINDFIIPAEAALAEDEAYKNNVQDLLNQVTAQVTEFNNFCTDLIDSNQDITEELNAFKAQFNERLNGIPSVITTEALANKYTEIYPIYKNQIDNLSTLDACAEMDTIMTNLEMDFVIKDGTIQSIENQTSDESFNNYSSAKQDEIRTLVQAYAKKIADIETFDMEELSTQMTMILNEFTEKKDEIPTIEEEFSQEKTKYKELLNNYNIDSNLYNYDKVVEIQTLIENAISDIDNTSDISEVKGIYDKCLEDIAKVPTKDQETESLNAYKTEKLNDFKKNVSKSLYFSEEQKQIDDIISALTTKVNNASTASLVDIAIDEATLDLAELKTKVAYKSEAIASISETSNCQLEENIASVKDKYDTTIENIQASDTRQKINDYVSQFNSDKEKLENGEKTYISSKISEINDVSLADLNHYLKEAQDTRDEAINDINNATSKVQVESIVADYKSMIENYKKDENAYQQVVQAKEAALNELNSLTEECEGFLSPYKERAKEEISDAILKINAATTTSRIQQVLNIAKNNVSYIRTENQEEVDRLKQLETDKSDAKEEANALREWAETFLPTYKAQAIQKIDKAIVDIDACNTSSSVSSVIERLKIDFNSISLENTNEVKRLEQLETTKNEAITAINNIDLTSLNETNLAEANEIVESAIENINKATTTENVSLLKNEAISQLNAILDSNKEEDELAKELEAAKNSAITELENLDYSEFTETHQTELQALIEEAINQINEATTKSEILPIVDEVKNEFNRLKLEEANLKTTKISAKNELNLISTNGLLEKNILRIQTVKSNYETSIDNCSSVAEVNAALEEAKEIINQIKQEDYEEQHSTTEEQALTLAKQNAIEILNNVSTDGLLEKNVVAINSLVDETKESINTATSVNQVSDILNTCMNEINQIKVADAEEQSGSRELIASKRNAIETLNNIDLEGLLEKNKTEITSLIVESKDKIDASTTVEEVRNELKKTINQINNIKALDKLEQENMTMLSQAKVDAINILNNIDTTGLLEENQVLISDLITEAIENINATTSINEVNEILANATTEIDGIKVDDTKEQADINSLAKTKQLAIQVLDSIVLDNFKDSYKNEALEVINKAKSDIQSATRRETVTNVLSKAVIDVNEIKERNRIEVELDNYKLSLVSQLNTVFIQKDYFSDEQIETFNDTKETVVNAINEATNKENALSAYEAGVEEYESFITQAFASYKTTVKTEVEELYNETIKISSDEGDTKLSETLAEISNTNDESKPQQVKAEFFTWLETYKEEIIINDISYSEPVVEGSTTLNKSKFVFDIKNRMDKVIDITENDFEIIEFNVTSKTTGVAKIEIKDLGEHSIDIEIREFTLEEIKERLVKDLQETYQNTIKHKTEELDEAINEFIDSINASEDKEIANEMADDCINFINEKAQEVYQETLSYPDKISIDDSEIDKEKLVYNLKLYNGETINPTYEVSSIMWNVDTPYIEITTDEVKILNLELEDGITIENLINDALSKLDEYKGYTFSDLSEQFVEKLNETKTEINKLSNIAEYKEKYSNLISDFNSFNDKLKEIETLRNNYLEKIHLLDISTLKDEYKEILTEKIDTTIKDISSLKDKTEMEELYEELFNKVEYYKQLQRDELDLKEFKDKYIEQANKIDTSVYKKEDEVKGLIDEVKLVITNAKNKEEVEELWKKFEAELKNFELIPEETSPEETSPEETTPEETSPEETSPEETSPEETSEEESSETESSSEETESSKPEESSESESTEESSTKPSETETTSKLPESSETTTKTNVVNESSVNSQKQTTESSITNLENSTEISNSKEDGVSEKVKTEDSSKPFLLASIASLGLILTTLFKKKK